jgi:hypothetical protein
MFIGALNSGLPLWRYIAAFQIDSGTSIWREDPKSSENADGMTSSSGDTLFPCCITVYTLRPTDLPAWGFMKIGCLILIFTGTVYSSWSLEQKYCLW